MADLDDFFAKKDRKKKPTKKYVTHEDLSKKLEITTPKIADTKSKKEQPQKPSNPSDNDAEIDPNAVAEVRIACMFALYASCMVLCFQFSMGQKKN